MYRLRAAFADGRVSGLDPAGSAKDCPFLAQQPRYRSVWHAGYGLGRTELRAAIGYKREE